MAGSKAVRLVRTGPDETGDNLVEVVHEVKLGDGSEVLLRVDACGVCHRDLIDRRGGNRFTSQPIILGHEIAGTILQVGAAAERVGWAAGERVVVQHTAPCGSCPTCTRDGGNAAPRCTAMPQYLYGITHDGGYQEQVTVHHRSLLSLPPAVSSVVGCFLFCTAGVALRALRFHGGMRRGMTVLVTGASGGVGVHAVQVAKAYGCRVIATTSRDSRRQELLDLGADHVLVISKSLFHRQVRALIPEGVDIALELVGEPTFNSSLRSVRPLGTVVVIGNVSTSPVKVNLGQLILFEVLVTGSSSATAADMKDVFSMVEDGSPRPVVSKVLPLSKDSVLVAHRQLQSGRGSKLGRIVLAPAHVTASL